MFKRQILQIYNFIGWIIEHGPSLPSRSGPFFRAFDHSQRTDFFRKNGKETEDRERLVITLYNVCSVHRGMFSTSGDIMSTLGDIMSTSGGYHEYIGGIS